MQLLEPRDIFFVTLKHMPRGQLHHQISLCVIIDAESMYQR